MSSSPPADPTNEPEIVVDVTPPLEARRALPTRMRLRRALPESASSPICQRLYLRRIASLGVEESYSRGAAVFAEGSVGDKLYVILTGSIRIKQAGAGHGRGSARHSQDRRLFRRDGAHRRLPTQRGRHRPRKLPAACSHQRERRDLLFVDRDLAYDLLWSFVRTLSARLRETNDKMTFLAVSSRF